MKTLAYSLLPLALLACKGDTEVNIGNTDHGDVDYKPTRAADEEVTGNLSEGSTFSSLDWAETLYCWPATENMNFNGAHVLYERTQGQNRDFILRVDPEGGVDVSIYAIQRSSGDSSLPPGISGQPNCEAMYDAQDDDNPGQAEVLFVQGYNEYSLLIGVAGANGDTTGEYTLQIWDEPGPNFDTQ